MHMGVGQCRFTGVQHQRDADLRTQVLGVSLNGAQRFGCHLKQQALDDGLVGPAGRSWGCLCQGCACTGACFSVWPQAQVHLPVTRAWTRSRETQECRDQAQENDALHLGTPGRFTQQPCSVGFAIAVQQSVGAPVLQR